MLTVKKTRAKKYTVTLTGDFTIYEAAEFKKELAPCVFECKSLVIDLAAVNEMDTSCFQVLMQAKRECDATGKEMQMVSHSPAVLEILDLFGMGRFFGDPLFLASDGAETIASDNANG
jgi:anti-anti-sigma factor